jgi:hypothetical protein
MNADIERVGAGIGGARPWWERRWFLMAVVLATMIPLLYPQFPPLVDLPGHIGRYRVELDLSNSPWLQRYYDYHWRAIGNLGIDLLVFPLGKLIGLEPAVKLIVLLIPPMSAAGMLWVAHEVHGRVPPTAYFALPFIYGLPFQFGFVNFALSVALAFVAFGLWLHLGRLGRIRLRGWLFAPIALIVFFCHTYGWGMLGLMCFSAEALRIRERGYSWWKAAPAAALHVSVMALPLIAVFASPGGRHSPLTIEWFSWGAKWIGLLGALRDRWGPFDVAAIELAAIIFMFALVSPKLALARSLTMLTVVFALCFILFPRYIADSAYADARLLPYLFAVALLAIGFRDPSDARLQRLFAIAALGFFVIRLAGTTASFAIASNDQRTRLAVLEAMPRGARVASFFGLPTAEPWALHRESHLGGFVIARREGFSNDQWITGAFNLLELRYRQAGTFGANPSQVVRPNGEGDAVYRTIDQALAEVPRGKFDYIWLIDVPPFDRRLLAGMQPVRSAPGSTLYRIRR